MKTILVACCFVLCFNKSENFGQKNQKSRPSAENMPGLQPPIHLAQEMGESLDRGKILQ